MMGYRRYRPYYDDPELGFLVPMVLLLDDIPHLQAIRSPLAVAAAKFPADLSNARWFVETFPEYQHFVSPVTIGPEVFSEILARKINDASVDLFDGLRPGEIEVLLKMASHLEIPAKAHIARQGQFGESLFVVLNGVAQVRRTDANGQVRILGTMGRGDVFGEMAVLTGRTRSAGVVAESALELVSIDRASLMKFMKKEPVIASKLLFNLCRLMSERIQMREQQWDEPASRTLGTTSSSY